MNKSEKEKIYNEIMEFYNFAGELVTIAENENLSSEQLEIVENLIENIERNTDNLTTEYIEAVKDGTSYLSIDSINRIFDIIIANIEESQIKIKNG